MLLLSLVTWVMGYIIPDPGGGLAHDIVIAFSSGGNSVQLP